MRVTVIALLVSSFAFAAPRAQALLRNTEGKKVGTADFTSVDGGVHVTLKVKGFSPGPHGFHVHELGSCVGPDFISAGGHFNPDEKKHGGSNPSGAHVGDLDNLAVDVKGDGTGEFIVLRASLDSAPGGLLKKDGTSLVLHADADDLKTDPAGNSGARIACGVIRAKK
ncbi:MAG: superoxide dismutase family protein [Myxococcales bacterium]|nr:superoxide dismutase family protein [Myxococcales bacterium]